MIYTVTCNPALDCTVTLERLVAGEMNRTTANVLTPSGKGVNVSRMLAALGQENVALGFAAGETGNLLKKMLTDRGVRTDFVGLAAGATRINVKLYADTETELNAPGAAVDEAALTALLDKLTTLDSGDVLCVCGSLAPQMPSDTYARLLTAVAGKGVYTVLDTAGQPLLAALSAHPWLIKPNRQEMSDLLGEDIRTVEQAAEAAAKLQAKGARNVLVSLGGEGALLCTEEGRRYHLPAPDGTVRGTVGAGDSAVAGFVTGWLTYGALTEALRLGVACGSATAFAGELASGEQIRAVLERVAVPTEM
ncbi:MAG: 1-phosphofructokinase [Clostridia bacterium]|nr:1-phosphofructokinase [Clostridia bacterium]